VIQYHKLPKSLAASQESAKKQMASGGRTAKQSFSISQKRKETSL
jgi:hypothetical protein